MSGVFSTDTVMYFFLFLFFFWMIITPFVINWFLEKNFDQVNGLVMVGGGGLWAEEEVEGLLV